MRQEACLACVRRTAEQRHVIPEIRLLRALALVRKIAAPKIVPCGSLDAHLRTDRLRLERTVESKNLRSLWYISLRTDTWRLAFSKQVEAR